jgi:hypothetical protein
MFLLVHLINRHPFIYTYFALRITTGYPYLNLFLDRSLVAVDGTFCAIV